MQNVTYRLYAIDWRLLLALTSIATFVLAGVADEPSGM